MLASYSSPVVVDPNLYHQRLIVREKGLSSKVLEQHDVTTYVIDLRDQYCFFTGRNP